MLRPLIETHLTRMALQLVNSSVPSTRQYWREKLNMVDAPNPARVLEAIVKEHGPITEEAQATFDRLAAHCDEPVDTIALEPGFIHEGP